MNTVEELLTIDELAAFLKMRKSSIYQMTRPHATGERIPHIKIGKHLRFKKSEVMTHFEKNKTKE